MTFVDRPPPRSALLFGGAALTILGIVACQPADDDGRVTTVIGDRAVVTFDRPLCGGDVAVIEQTIAHVESELNMRIEGSLEISIWNRYADVAARCSEGPTGCFTDGEVHALWEAVEHEVVHAASVPVLGIPEPLWLEGIAEALSGRTYRGPVDVASLVGLEDSRQVDYPTAGHFVRWLREDRGVEGIQALARGTSFEDAYGVPLDDVIEGFEQNAPWSYPDWNACLGSSLDQTEADGWVHDIAVSCDDLWGLARFDTGPSVLRTVDVDTAGIYRLAVDGALSVSVVACQLEVLADEPESDMAGDIMRESSGLRIPTVLLGDEVHEVELEPGRLQLMIVAGGSERTVGFDLRRADP